MTMTDIPTWELSPAHDSYYHERRDFIARLLCQWGSTTNGRWPDLARFVSLSEEIVSPRMLHDFVHIGKASIEREISGVNLARLFPNRTWAEQIHHVHFIDGSRGNVNKGKRAPNLLGYIIGPTYLRIIELGCDHPNATRVRGGFSYIEHACPDCGYSWAVDTSD